MEACLLLFPQATGAEQRRVANSAKVVYSLVSNHNIANYVFDLVVTRLLLVFVCRFLVQFRVGNRVACGGPIRRVEDRTTD